MVGVSRPSPMNRKKASGAFSGPRMLHGKTESGRASMGTPCRGRWGTSYCGGCCSFGGFTGAWFVAGVVAETGATAATRDSLYFGSLT